MKFKVPGSEEVVDISEENDEDLEAATAPVVEVSVGPMRAARSPEDRPKAAAAAVTKTGVLRTYVFVPEAASGEVVAKLPLQARVIVTAAGNLVAEGYDKFTNKDLTDASVKAGLVTRQLPERIVAYYLPTLRGKGIVV